MCDSLNTTIHFQINSVTDNWGKSIIKHTSLYIRVIRMSFGHTIKHLVLVGFHSIWDGLDSV